MYKCLLITINYHNYSLTREFVKSVSLLDNPELFEIAIVDNESISNEFDDLASKYPFLKIHTIYSKKNLGYFGGARLAFDRLYETPKYDHVIISNNDIFFNSMDFFSQLSQWVNTKPVGAIAPAIYLKKSSVNQNPFLKTRYSKIAILKNKFFLSNYYLMKIRNLLSKVKNNKKDDLSSNNEIFAPHGAFIILTNMFFSKGGEIDNKFFLYGEENSIGYQCLSLELKVIYDPSFSVIHDEHQTTSNYSRFTYNEQKKAFSYIQNKYRKWM